MPTPLEIPACTATAEASSVSGASAVVAVIIIIYVIVITGTLPPLLFPPLPRIQLSGNMGIKEPVQYTHTAEIPFSSSLRYPFPTISLSGPSESEP